MVSNLEHMTDTGQCRVMWISYSSVGSGKLVTNLRNILASDPAFTVRAYEKLADHPEAQIPHSTGSAADQDRPVDSDNATSPKAYYLLPGDRINELVLEIASCPRVLAVLSPEYFDSKYCLLELAMLLASCRAQKPLFLFHRMTTVDILGDDLRIVDAIIECWRNKEFAVNSYPGFYRDLDREFVTNYFRDISDSIMLTSAEDCLDGDAIAGQVSTYLKTIDSASTIKTARNHERNALADWLRQPNSFGAQILADIKMQQGASCSESEIAGSILENPVQQIDTVCHSLETMKTQPRFQTNWRRDVGLLAGFFARGLVDGDMIDALGGCANGVVAYVAIKPRPEESLEFDECVVVATLVASSVEQRLLLLTKDSRGDIWPNVITLPEYSAAAGDQSKYPVREFVEYLYSVVYNKDAKGCPNDDPAHRTNMTAKSRRKFRRAVKEYLRRYAMYLVVKRKTISSNTSWWYTDLSILLDSLNDGAAPESCVSIKALIICSQERGNLLIVNKKYSEVLAMVERILEV